MWQLRRVRRMQSDTERRLLLISAAGSAGEKAVEKLWHLLGEQTGSAKAKDESSIPRSQEEFERMMTEDPN